ncbi:hypothetical protein L873DRAFT_1808574 [Choiromyces venosus 120613-1]|uniref:Uncharacterized protein n=1 Tax=Choiromyces venosus 120613-1 TaxID=1336337 RepID=A0A3N4JJ77_9PEZI|nr:hypothetical protein L873DRAFT_1808574 [Choiromyces venosus 120613-1]
MCFMNSRVQHAVKVAFPAIESYLHSVAPTKEVLSVERLLDDANEVDNEFQGHGTLVVGELFIYNSTRLLSDLCISSLFTIEELVK